MPEKEATKASSDPLPRGSAAGFGHLVSCFFCIDRLWWGEQVMWSIQSFNRPGLSLQSFLSSYHKVRSCILVT